jgi:four helix bundle protein
LKFEVIEKIVIMATITKFEDLEIWQLAYQQCKDFDSIAEQTALGKDFGLRNQMNASSGSVMDNIAEGFERSGNNEFKNFLLIAKGSNGEFRSQLYRCLNRKYILQEKFDELHTKNTTLGNKLMAFISYLQNSSYKGQRYKKDESPKPQTSNIKP